MTDRRRVAAATTARDLAVAAARGEPLLPLLADVMEVLRADAGVGLTQIQHDDGGVQVSVDVHGSQPVTAEMGRLAAEVADQHPAILTLSTARSTRVSDLVAIRDFWHTDVYERMHGHADGRYPIAVLLHQSATAVTFLGAHRTHTDFRPDDVEVIEQIQRPLVAALNFRAALEATTALLRNERPDPSPGAVRSPLSSAAALGAGYRPTQREAEVLALVAAGWTNVRIARRLGITERTVRKHLGAVYEQSGRRGRAAAAAWWTELRERS